VSTLSSIQPLSDVEARGTREESKITRLELRKCVASEKFLEGYGGTQVISAYR
jgi:hypothetical protein